LDAKAISSTDDDRLMFLKRWKETCVRALRLPRASWVLMDNHFRVLLETLQLKLVAGMDQLFTGVSISTENLVRVNRPITEWRVHSQT
jgi:hypothetical protein